MAVVKTGAAIDRVVFFIMMLLLMCHFIGCFWIFMGRGFQDDDVEFDSWIEASNIPNDMLELYVAATYFTMQTLTTVGYGDISIVRLDEMMLVILLQFIGVLCFSFASGSLTALITNTEDANNIN